MAGTTSAVLYFKPAESAGFTRKGKTNAVVYFAVRELSGSYQSNLSIVTSKTVKKFLPNRSVPIGYVVINGQKYPVEINRDWYELHADVVNRRLGGANGITVPDLAASITSLTIDDNSAAIAALQQAVETNASTLAAQVEITKSVALPGAIQIPPAVTSVPETNKKPTPVYNKPYLGGDGGGE